ncbi:hypothetical protein ASPZODRAFT_94492 [Penicilliopsis zonata CBS 506.65]|uniref:C2H2-type domain-containing protein n=1 Tax=Penicilliopsis zonata CBS 506.65 TaxID=1073090 RepID=A0A1L9SKG6_9EURO|nr:hypothetical protein ASPZODRAFT_94492 [Penicilliopsis zonata CBS 506.65]OJJ47729.1 hypothetical protein ASPZODRAFT_94492 [Penicilliopsis zonata CBS 506.65]
MVLKKCTICDRRFKKTEHFKRHERSHTKERPYECQVCHKRFSRSDVLGRHAKGHNQANGATVRSRNNAVDESAQASRPSAMAATAAMPGVALNHNNNNDDLHTLPARVDGLTGTPHQAAATMTSLPPANIPSSSLGFLADISSHQRRTEPRLDPSTAIEGQQPSYLGWNEVVSLHPPGLRAPDPMPNDLLQLWLEPCAESGSQASFGDQQGTPQPGDSIRTGDDIPNERFAKVQRCWMAPSNHKGRLMNTLWRDLATCSLDSIFSAQQPEDQPSFFPDQRVDLGEALRYGLDEECRQHLLAMFGPLRLVHHPQLDDSNPDSHLPPHHLSPAATTAANPASFPPVEVLDMALDLYFRNFHPLVPFVHLPSFYAKRTRLPLLYVMCLIGMVMLGTKGTTDFVSRNFTSVLDKLTVELTRCSLGANHPIDTMSTFAAALLFLHLAALTGEKDHLEQCQMLYVNLMSIAQRHGLFAANEGQILDMSLFEAVSDMDLRWKAWSRVEAVKRLIVALLLLDSWYSSFFSTGPIIVPDSVQLILPCDSSLFRASNSMRWMQLVHSGKRILMPTVMAPSENIELPKLESSVDGFGVHAVLAMIELRLTESYHRLLSNRAHYPFAPCHTYAMDGRARCLPSLQLQVANHYGEMLERLTPNSTIMWHHMCMMLTADIQIFELAAGRAGPGPARKALDDVAAWSQTPAARRACLHAAQIYRAMTNRKASDHTMFHSVVSLFNAALVLGLYTFMVPPSAESQVGTSSIEVFDDIDWKQVGSEGFTSFMEPLGSQSFAPSDDAVVNFIRNGGTIYLRGVPFRGGYLSARRILLDYAGLLKDAGKWSVRKFSYVLHIMSDVLMDVD